MPAESRSGRTGAHPLDMALQQNKLFEVAVRKGTYEQAPSKMVYYER
jgi:hypothetical protein